jgi:hypothetical protein
VSDPLQFNQYVVDMVVAKQGTTTPKWEELGEQPPIAMGRGLRRIRLSRRRRAAGADDYGSRAPSSERQRPPRDQRRQGQSAGGDVTQVSGPYDDRDDDDVEQLDAETLAERLRSSQTDLPWGG